MPVIINHGHFCYIGFKLLLAFVRLVLLKQFCI